MRPPATITRRSTNYVANWIVVSSSPHAHTLIVTSPERWGHSHSTPLAMAVSR